MALSQSRRPISGRLTERVTFQEVTQAKDAQYGTTETWANIGTSPTVSAEVIPMTGKEILESQQLRAESSVKIRIRARSDLNSKMRVKHGTTTYQIDYVPPYIRQQFMVLLCHVTA